LQKAGEVGLMKVEWLSIATNPFIPWALSAGILLYWLFSWLDNPKEKDSSGNETTSWERWKPNINTLHDFKRYSASILKNLSLFIYPIWIIIIALELEGKEIRIWQIMSWSLGGSIFIALIFVTFFDILNYNIAFQKEKLSKIKSKMQELINPNRMYERMGVDPLSIQVGNDLLVLADPEQEGQLIYKIAGLRTTLTDDLGYVIPNVRIMDSINLGKQEFLISVRSIPTLRQTVYPDKVFVVHTPYSLHHLNNLDPIPAESPTGKPGGWYCLESTADFRNQLQQDRNQELVHQATPEEVPTLTATEYIVECLKTVCIHHVDEVMSKMDVLKLMELMKQSDPTAVDDLVPELVTEGSLRYIFVNLIRERVSIKDIQLIFERLYDNARVNNHIDLLSERLRRILSRQICLSHSADGKTLNVIKLSPEWESVLETIEKEQTTPFQIDYNMSEEELEALQQATKDSLLASEIANHSNPIIVCKPKNRLLLFRLLAQQLPNVIIISDSELIPDMRVKTVGTITKEP
jgi:flagellar biosynthesis protein FlhA